MPHTSSQVGLDCFRNHSVFFIRDVGFTTIPEVKNATRVGFLWSIAKVLFDQRPYVFSQ